MLKYTNSTLHKFENILKESGYTVRYERGNFKPGYCVLESKQVVVINKYYNLEARINAIAEIISELEISAADLSEKSVKFLQYIRSQNLVH